jgi:ABC-type proline/glycine betaine transport system ATPase subunit
MSFTILFIEWRYDTRYVRIMVMREANIVQLDTPENIVDHPADDYVKNFVLRNLQIKIDSLVKYVRTEK